MAERWPGWLKRTEAAAYLDMSPSTFDDYVSQGKLPAAAKLGAKRGCAARWQREALDEAMAQFVPGAQDPIMSIIQRA